MSPLEHSLYESILLWTLFPNLSGERAILCDYMRRLFIHVFGYYSFMGKSIRKGTHSLIRMFWGSCYEKAKWQYKELNEGKDET